MKLQRIPQQLIPLIIIFAGAVAGLLVARQMLVPETFGEFGHYRAAATDEIMAQDIAYAGYTACLDCHDDVFEAKNAYSHRGLSCEVCHGPAAQHIEEPDEYTPTAPRGRGYCPLCHGYNPARPSGFPQIIPEVHNPGQACMTCHDPHSPSLPHAPEDCSACHRQIASQKQVSHHTTLECTTCHMTPEDHAVNPRLAKAEKPTSKELCGQCHAEDAESGRGIPRIDLTTHGGRYVCWDCHYPHHPEANL